MLHEVKFNVNRYCTSLTFSYSDCLQFIKVWCATFSISLNNEIGFDFPSKFTWPEDSIFNKQHLACLIDIKSLDSQPNQVL